MKFRKITAVVLVVFSLFCIIFAVGCAHTKGEERYGLIRIHIRANSNAAEDQAIKLDVRDALNVLIEEKVKDVDSFEEAYRRLKALLPSLKKIADGVLKNGGFDYESKVRLNNEFFPTRIYESVVVESGYYDALIVELGEGGGDNWWCVVYPPLCYVSAGADKAEYRSIIVELWKKFRDTFRK